MTASTSRRSALLAGFATVAAFSNANAADVSPAAIATPTSERFPVVLPRTEFVYEAIVDIAPPMTLGASPFGERFMVPITGGSFEGPGLRGTVLAGGADRQ